MTTKAKSDHDFIFTYLARQLEETFFFPFAGHRTMECGARGKAKARICMDAQCDTKAN